MGNLLGEPFKDYVDAQINVRQDVHGKANRSLQELQYLNSKNAWIKLASGTSFEQERLDLLKSPTPGIENPLLTGVIPGFDLAIQNVLFNGLTGFGGVNTERVEAFGLTGKLKGKNDSGFYNYDQTQREGITGANRAYGVGGTQQHGYSPMPGIIDADIKDLNRGSIKKATINLKAHNRNQFDVIDALYLRLGYTVMLEWGVDKYLSDRGLQSVKNTLIDRKFWTYTDSSYNEILPAIEELRKKHQGNYDGMFGVISNFSWTFEADGTYSIKLEIMSQGDVIESLKANTPPSTGEGETIDPYDTFTRNLAANQETTDSISFFNLYPGLEQIITDWYNLARRGNAKFRPLGDWEDYPYQFPSLDSQLYTNKNEKNQSQGRKLLSYLFFSRILSNSLQWVETRRENERSSGKWGSGKYAGFNSQGILKIGTSGDDWRQSSGLVDESFLQKLEDEDVKDLGLNRSNVARLIWINNIGWPNIDDGLSNLLDKVWAYAKSENFAGGPNDEQFEAQQPDEDKTPEEIEVEDTEEALELKKNKNKVNNFLYRARNCWVDDNNGTTVTEFNGNFESIGLSEWEIGKGINPIGGKPTERSKIWNEKVGFPIYPRITNVPLNPVTLKPTSGGSMGDTGSDRPNSVDFIRLNLTSPDKQHFIRLGVLLEFLEQKIIPKIETGSKKNQPMLLIDYHPENNICYTIDNVISLNPNKIILRNPSFYTGTFNEDIFKNAKDFKRNISGISNGPIWGNIMNLYFNFSRIEELFENVDEKNEVSVYSILKNLSTDINESLGNINNIEPIIDKETNTIKFIDQTPIPELESIAKALKITLKPQSDTVLEIFGINPTNNTSNFVRSAGITTEISKEYATIITIGATANGAIPGTEATAFSRWNVGIKDRFKTRIIDGETKKGNEELEKQNEEVLKNYGRFIQRKIQKLGFTQEKKDIFIINDELISINKESASNYYKYAQAETSKANNTIESSIGFLPFNLKLSMDGLSGIKIYNKVNVNTSFLPTNYGDTLSFIITGVNHKLSGNEWVTNLDTIATTKTKQKASNSVDTEELLEDEKQPQPSSRTNPTPVASVVTETFIDDEFGEISVVEFTGDNTPQTEIDGP